MQVAIGIIGFGHMGSAIAQQLKKDFQIYIFDRDSSKTSEVAELQITLNNSDLAKKVDTVILAVKPQDLNEVLNEIKADIDDKLLISISAGVSCEHIEGILDKVRLIRTMPNIAAKIGQGVTCLAKGRFASEEDLTFTQDLFNHLGETIIIEERLMDAATAIASSGLAFFYYLIDYNGIRQDNLDALRNFAEDVFTPQLKDIARKMGFSNDQAIFLAFGTSNSSIELLLKTKLTAETLRKQITSKGGTTEAGLDVLREGGSLLNAIKAAIRRAAELSKGG